MFHKLHELYRNDNDNNTNNCSNTTFKTRITTIGIIRRITIRNYNNNINISKSIFTS